jgi:hypothetical protein
MDNPLMTLLKEFGPLLLVMVVVPIAAIIAVRMVGKTKRTRRQVRQFHARANPQR